MNRVHFERLRNVLICVGLLSDVIYVASAIGASSYSANGVRIAIAPATITVLEYTSFCLPAGLLLGAILSKTNTSYWILGILAYPVLLIVVGFVQLMTQTPMFMNYATTSDGRTFLLAQDPGLGSNFSWSIWRPIDRAGFIWALGNKPDELLRGRPLCVERKACRNRGWTPAARPARWHLDGLLRSRGQAAVLQIAQPRPERLFGKPQGLDRQFRRHSGTNGNARGNAFARRAPLLTPTGTPSP